MKWNSIFLLTLLVFSISACANADADLERAEYILGKGGNPDSAISLATPYLDSSDANTRYKAVSVVAAAEIQQAGYNAAKLISVLVHKEDGEEFEDVLGDALSNVGGVSNAQELTRSAISRLRTIVGSLENEVQAPGGSAVAADSDFSVVSARLQNNLKFQLGLARLLESMRISLVESGFLETETFTLATCQEILGNAENGETNADQTARFIENSRQNFRDVELAASNDLVDLITDFQAEFDSNQDGDAEADDICNAISN